jgi:hypothetical protein
MWKRQAIPESKNRAALGQKRIFVFLTPSFFSPQKNSGSFRQCHQDKILMAKKDRKRSRKKCETLFFL